MAQEITLEEYNKAYKTRPTQDVLSYRRMGKGDPLILLHGAMVSGVMFSLKSVAEELSENYDVIIPDLRGHGKSKNMPGPYTTVQHAEDTKKLLDALNIKSAYILGYSYGGVVAQQITYMYPSLVNKLILTCTISYNKITLREKIEGIIILFALRLLGVNRLAHLTTSHDPELNNNPALKKEMQKMFADNDTKAAAAVLKEAFTFDSRSWVHNIRCPTLIIGGSADIATPIHHPYFLHDKIKGSQLEIFEDAGHILIWTHSERLVSVVKKFLR
ncbi:alpha/beta hydrolase [Dehalococcoidia bacterium]|nr:alpha/beta hydrolase [Dehalococcoidia bacterium]